MPRVFHEVQYTGMKCGQARKKCGIQVLPTTTRELEVILLYVRACVWRDCKTHLATASNLFCR